MKRSLSALHEALADDLRRRRFRPARAGALPRIGAEIEVIPVAVDERRIAPIQAGERCSSLDLLRTVASISGWTEHLSAKGAPVFSTPEGGKLTFEPGGQIEYGSPPMHSATALVDQLQRVGAALRQAAEPAGIDLLSLGIDPINAVSEAPLQLRSTRYARMARHFETLGAAGARMMRQTASIQLNLDRTSEGDGGWRLVNALTPYLVALFANSHRYADRDSGHQSFRAHCWRTLDPSRTGIPCAGSDPALEYAEFALNARAILVGDEELPAPTYGEWLLQNDWNTGEWDEHLSTLFPEVRPRGYLEVRSIDAISPEWYAAPIALVSGLLYDRQARRAAAELLGMPNAHLLCHAGIVGLTDPVIARTAAELVGLALAGCVRLGSNWLTAAHLEAAGAYFDSALSRAR